MAEKESVYLLSYDFESPSIYCVESDTKGFNEYRFYDGKWINDWPGDILFVVEGEPIANFLLCDLHFRLISDRVRHALLDRGVQGVQFLPVRIIHRKTKQDLGPYWALNVLKTVDKLRWNFVQDIDIFRWGVTSVYISESLKKYLEEADLLSGAGFLRVPHKTLDRPPL